ncbi:DUF2975 domain-containing protein [Vulcaniibacterium tengchongense]|uniref:DUF2975 family protein n=1 Tax=Vulcaniibacterium tengchongense TaxID=1273429 RepID=A0A3N4VEP1_9GAMM|nr:DUF2975 domain-containing protein [Vulcaniibacterium tengchongense]RPE79975.1 DUF2975 family protein [Vulcaniibacterium tengchongense]
MTESVNGARRRARTVRRLLACGIAGLALANAWLWWQGGAGGQYGGFGVEVDMPAYLQPHPRVALASASVLSAVLLYGLLRLSRLMRLFERGEFFSAAATRHLRAFAWALALLVPVDVLLPPALLGLLAAAGWAEVREVRLQLEAAHFWALLGALLFLLVASLMAEARRLAEDNAQIV